VADRQVPRAPRRGTRRDGAGGEPDHRICRPPGIEEAKAQIARSWTILDAALARHGQDWAAGAAFGLADCAAAPAIFYANVVQPFDGLGHVEAYFERLLDRPSFARCKEEAKPYWKYFPLEWPESYL
jgi:glutathione S-transferase